MINLCPVLSTCIHYDSNLLLVRQGSRNSGHNLFARVNDTGTVLTAERRGLQLVQLFAIPRDVRKNDLVV